MQFMNFLNLMGHQIDMEGWTGYRGDFSQSSKIPTFYENWNNIEVIYHIAPWLSTDEQRRFIGNDMAIIIFVEATTIKFDPTHLDQLGTIPQVVILVQPVSGEIKADVETKYRLAFISRKNLKSSMPLTPFTPLDITTTKNLILTKLHNSLVIAKRCPPFDRLFYVPRSQFIAEIVEKFPPVKKAKFTRFKNLKVEQKKIEHIPASFQLSNSLSTWDFYCEEKETKHWMKVVKDATKQCSLLSSSVLNIHDVSVIRKVD